MMQKNENRPGYKKTKVGWIPEEWKCTRFDNLIHLQRGFDLPQASRSKGTVPIFASNGLIGCHNEAQVKAPGLVTGRSGSIGKVSFVEHDFWPLNTTLFVTDFHGNSPLFSFYFLLHFKLNRFANGTGVPTLNRNDVHPQKIPLPPLPEQEAIAGVLECWDGGIRKLELKLEKKRAIKKGLMQRLLSGKRRLPGFSEVWKTVKLGEILTFKTGFPFESKFFNEDNNGIRLVKNRDLKTNNKRYFYSGKYNSEFLIKNNDVLVGMDGDFSPCLWNKGVALLNQRVGKIYATERSDSRFLFYFLYDPLKRLERATASTTVKHLSHSNIESLTLNLPPLDEQRAIAEVLSAADREIEVLERKLERWREQKRFLLNNLVTGTIRLPEFCKGDMNVARTGENNE